jgi:hypothetical protein
MPLRYAGTIKWVHTTCLNNWCLAQRRGSGRVQPVRCEMCRAQYRVSLRSPALPRARRPKTHSAVALLLMLCTSEGCGCPVQIPDAYSRDFDPEIFEGRVPSRAHHPVLCPALPYTTLVSAACSVPTWVQ